jgi:hypothetical protein
MVDDGWLMVDDSEVSSKENTTIPPNLPSNKVLPD